MSTGAKHSLRTALLCFTAVAAIFSQGAAAAPPPGTSSTAIEKKSPWDLGFSVDHYLASSWNMDSFTVFGVDASYALDSRNKLQIIQTGTQQWYVDTGARQFDLGDTELYHHFTVDDDFHGFGIKLRSGIIPATSFGSREAGAALAVSERISFSREFFSKTLTLAYRPTLRYNFNAYNSTVDGEPLPQASVGNSILILYHPTEAIEISGIAGGSIEFMQQQDYAASAPPTSGSYLFSIGASYAITPHFSPRVGIEQANGYIHGGRYETYLYDPENTRYIVALDLTI